LHRAGLDAKIIVVVELGVLSGFLVEEKTMSGRRSISCKVSLVVLVAVCGLTAPGYGFAGGTGEPNDPYQIATAEDLIGLGADPNLWDSHFVLVADIDLDPNLPGRRAFGDAVIAPDTSGEVGGHGGDHFSGVLDGRGHAIHNLRIEGTYGYDAGLFGKLSGLVRDLHLRDVVVSGSPCGAMAGLNLRGTILRCSVTGRISGTEDVGGMVGSHWDASLVQCECEVQVSGDRSIGGMVGGGPGGLLVGCTARVAVNGDSYVGGLVGESSDTQIIESHTSGTVIGRDRVGGLVGRLGRAVILRCAADCDVTAERSAGGLLGDVSFGRNCLLADCYARGTVAGSIVGGLVGDSHDLQMLNCYAACEILPLASGQEPAIAGGLSGKIWTSLWYIAAGCFWDVQVSGVDIALGWTFLLGQTLDIGTGLTTAQMQDKVTFEQVGWDFRRTWTMTGDGYPILQWELTDQPGEPDGN